MRDEHCRNYRILLCNLSHSGVPFALPLPLSALFKITKFVVFALLADVANADAPGVVVRALRALFGSVRCLVALNVAAAQALGKVCGAHVDEERHLGRIGDKLRVRPPILLAHHRSSKFDEILHRLWPEYLCHE